MSSLVVDNVNVAPTTSQTWPTLQVEIDITNKPTNPERVWTVIDPNLIRSCSYTLAGRSAETEDTQPGSLQLVLDNRDRAFDRDNLTSPYYPGLRWKFWIRVSAVFQGGVYPRWTGIKESLPKTRPNLGHNQLATIIAADAMRPLELFKLGGLTLPSAISGTRVTQILDAATVAAGVIDPGYANLSFPNITYEDNDTTSALSHLQQVERDERGLLFAGPDGTIDFQSRYYRALLIDSGPVATIGFGDGTIHYVEADLDDNGGYQFNVVAVTPAGGTVEIFRDADSIEESFERWLPIQMLADSQTAAQANASWYVHRYANSDQRVGPVEIIGATSPELWPLILSARNSDLFDWDGDDIGQQVHLERISEAWRPGSADGDILSVTWDLSPASREYLWRLDVPGRSELGVTTRLG